MNSAIMKGGGDTCGGGGSIWVGFTGEMTGTIIVVIVLLCTEESKEITNESHGTIFIIVAETRNAYLCKVRIPNF